MSKHLADYDSGPLYFKDAKDCYLYDIFGARYLDFIAGWCVGNLGWKRKEIIEAVKKEAEGGFYVPPFVRWRKWEELASLLCKIAPGKLSRAFRCTGGSEAVEFAIKCARATIGKKIIVSIDGVYHGHTYGAASVGNACNEKINPCAPGFVKLPMPTQKNFQQVIKQFEELVQKNDVAAFLSEPVFSNAGVFIPPPEFYPKIQEICRQYGVLLAMDEVAVGFGRCGKLFTSELWDLQPDIMCLGKGLTGGYGGAGATLVTEEVFKKSRGIPDYSTFGWVPNATAAMLENVKILLKKKPWESAKILGEQMLKSLKELEKNPKVKEVRGIGLMFGIELREPIARKIITQCALRGVLMAECDDHTLFISPPLVIGQKLADEGVRIIKKVIS
ncbi:MAG: aspartate aminotransferase family protein [Patescibacteria group bacterium]